jgi:hypothetical protein
MRVHAAAPPRWWIAPPMPDESLESVCERAHRHYKGLRLTEEGWLLDGSGARAACLASTVQGLVDIARRLNVPAADLQRTRSVDGPGMLHLTCRRAFCRACWLEDDAAGRDRYRRKAWAGVFALQCDTHNEPLIAAPIVRMTPGEVALSPTLPTYTSRERLVLRAINELAHALDASLFHGAAWSPTWRLPLIPTRNLLGRCVANLSRAHRSCPAQRPRVGPEHHPILHFRGIRRHQTCGSVWEIYRRIVQPAARRSALWLTWQIVAPRESEKQDARRWTAHFHRQDAEFLAHDDEKTLGRRTQRLRSALAREGQVWSVHKMNGGNTVPSDETFSEFSARLERERRQVPGSVKAKRVETLDASHLADASAINGSPDAQA